MTFMNDQHTKNVSVNVHDLLKNRKINSDSRSNPNHRVTKFRIFGWLVGLDS